MNNSLTNKETTPAIELKKLNRRELLEMLIEQGRENDQLRKSLSDAEAKLSDREIKLEKSGTIAEAALALNGIFAAADAAAAQYLENIRHCSEDKQADYDRVIAEAKKKADAIVADAQKKAFEIVSAAEEEAFSVAAKAKKAAKKSDNNKSKASTSKSDAAKPVQKKVETPVSASKSDAAKPVQKKVESPASASKSDAAKPVQKKVETPASASKSDAAKPVQKKVESPALDATDDKPKSFTQKVVVTETAAATPNESRKPDTTNNPERKAELLNWSRGILTRIKKKFLSFSRSRPEE